MAWLGEQLNSITGKINNLSYLLKDDGSEQIPEISNHNDILSNEALTNFCKEKDKSIELLTQENLSLQNSIEELDQQHQEATNKLLQLKSQLLTENDGLKEKVVELESKQHNLTMQYNSSYDFTYMSPNLQEALSSASPDFHLSEKDLNLRMLFELLSNNFGNGTLMDKIEWLQRQKQTLENDTCEEDKDIVNNLITRINDYANFLNTLNSQSVSVHPVINEICAVFSSLVSNIDSLNKKLIFIQSAAESTNLPTSSKYSMLELKTEESSVQTNLLCAGDFSTQYDCPCKNCSGSSKNMYDSTFSQTKLNIEEKDELINEFQATIELLKSEKEKLQCDLSNLTLQLDKNYVPKFTQTDTKEECNCNSLKSELDALKKEFTDLEHNYITLQKEHSNDLNEKVCAIETACTEKDTIIVSQKKEILLLKEKVKNLTSELTTLEHQTFCNKQAPVPNDCLVDKANENKTNEAVALQSKVTNLELEKRKLLCVLNEKSQECSSLKAEVHKLTSIVASEKQALLKLQQDNCELKDLNKDNIDPEIMKETIRKLGMLVRDKDFEIESLKQKNSTLTTLIQDASNIPEHLQSLLEEKENLSKQVNVYKTEREKFMVTYNNKDKECRKNAAELKELGSILSQQREKFDVLEQKHLSVAQQYEEKQKTLINTQNEMISLKQHITELEQQQVMLKEKYSDILNEMNSDSFVQVAKEELADKNTKLDSLTADLKEKDHLMEEKDRIIHDLSQQVKKQKMDSEQQQQLIQTLEKKITELMDKIVDLKSSMEHFQEGKLVMEQKYEDKMSEFTLLKDMNERLNMALKEKEFMFQSMTEKVSSLSLYINSDHSSSDTVDINQILADSEAMFSKAQSLYRERDESLLALNQSKQETQNLRNEIQRMKSSELHLRNELERLRQHLIEIEETYTNEALKYEEKEKQLKDELVEVHRRAEITSSAVVDTNQRASVQIASLQEQLSIIANQRDQALTQISSLEDEVLQHSTGASRLQLVLEQMQKGHERKVKDTEHKWQLVLQEQKKADIQLKQELQMKEMQLKESVQALEAASRLSEQLDAKEEVIANLRNELLKAEEKIKSTSLEINSMKSNTEGKVDRAIMKSLVLGYFSTPPGQKSEVIRLLARVLDFNQDEMERAGIVVGRQSKKQENKGLLSSIFSRLPSLSPTEHAQQQPEKSFSSLFVQFLENESQPIVPMPFPVEKMTHELNLKPFNSHNSLNTPNKSTPRKSPLLLDIDSAFPTFTPIPAVEYSTSPAPTILKEVLQ